MEFVSICWCSSVIPAAAGLQDFGFSDEQSRSGRMELSCAGQLIQPTSLEAKETMLSFRDFTVPPENDNVKSDC